MNVLGARRGRAFQPICARFCWQCGVCVCVWRISRAVASTPHEIRTTPSSTRARVRAGACGCVRV